VTTLLLVRHGETDWNRDAKWQGHSDIELNEVGRRQARELADTLDGVDVIYSSDLARARETAEILGERLGVEVRLDERLRERDFGAWEGLTMDEVEQRFREQHDLWRAGEGFGADDAESFKEFATRVLSCVDEILERHPGETVVLVGHGGSIRVIHAFATGLDYVRDHHSIPSVANCVVARYAGRQGKLAPLE
jgi:broad specificity phosphatase PhoE